MEVSMSVNNQSNKETIREFYKLINNDPDRDTLYEFFTENPVHHYNWMEFHGRDEYLDLIFILYDDFENNNFEVELMFEKNEYVASKTRWQAKHKQTGREIDQWYLTIVRFEDGKIAEGWTQIDILHRERQLGRVSGRALEVQYQYLKVLNRVLRHNLRNDLSLIAGHAEMIAKDETDVETAVAVIQKRSEQLLAIADKARELQTQTVDRQLDIQETDLTSILQEIIDDAREIDPTATLTLADSRSEVSIGTDPVLLQTILTELLENAVVHNDAAQPRVEVTLTVDETEPQMVTINIKDNGSGIPTHEVEPLDQASEDPLMHGSGIGLWAVKWGVERLNGTVEFPDTDHSGGIVRVSVPDLDSAYDLRSRLIS